MLYGVSDCSGCRENSLSALGGFGPGRKDIVPGVDFFGNVPARAGGRLADSVFTHSRSRAGSFVGLAPAMAARAVIFACPQANNPCNSSSHSAIRALVRRPPARRRQSRRIPRQR